jgi:hypothetical protein
MARNNAHQLNRFEHLGDDGTYEDPIREALLQFWVYSYSQNDHRDSPLYEGLCFTESVFYQSGRKVACLFDLAYVWLVEGQGANWCPTFESWLIFLIAFADETHRYRAGTVIPGWENILTGQGDDYGVPDKRLDTWDLMSWGQGADLHRSVDDSADRSDEEGFSHRVLRRDVYDAAVAHHLQRQQKALRSRDAA